MLLEGVFQPCAASGKEDFIETIIIQAAELPRPKQTGGCVLLPPITKALTAHILDPNLSFVPFFFLIKSLPDLASSSFLWCIFPTVITAVFSVFTLFCSGGIHYVAASRCAGHVWSVASIDAARALSVTYIWISRVIPFHYLYGVKWSPYIKCSHYAVHMSGGGRGWPVTAAAIVSSMTLA